MNNTTVLNAVMWYFGFNKTEARRYIKDADKNTIQALVDGFTGNAKKSFYND